MKRFFIASICLLFWQFLSAQIPRTLYVVNGLAETLTKINLETNSVTNHIVTLGVVPNQIVVHRKMGYVVNSISSNIQIIDLAGDSSVGVINLGAGRNPWNMAVADSQTAYVTNFSANTLSKLDLLNKTLIGEFPVGQSPEGLTFHDGKLYICITGFSPVNFTYGIGKIAVYDTTLDTVVSEIVVGKNPQAIHPDLNGNLQVICTGDYSTAFGWVYTIDPQTESVVDSTYLGGTPGPFGIDWTGIALFAAGGYSTDGWVYALDTEDDSILHDANNPLLVNLGAGDVTTDKYSRAYVSCFSASTIDVIDVLLDSVVSSFPVGDGPLSAALYDPKPDGDANGDQFLSLADIITIVNLLFKSTPLPSGSSAYGDANCDGRISLADAIRLVNYLFKSGPLPCDF